MTKTSSLGNRFQRAWGGEIHVSEPMRITLPSSNPKGCGIKGASVPIADAGADNGRRCRQWTQVPTMDAGAEFGAFFVILTIFLYRISVGDAVICTLQQTRVIAFVFIR